MYSAIFVTLFFTEFAGIENLMTAWNKVNYILHYSSTQTFMER